MDQSNPQKFVTCDMWHQEIFLSVILCRTTSKHIGEKHSCDKKQTHKQLKSSISFASPSLLASSQRGCCKTNASTQKCASLKCYSATAATVHKALHEGDQCAVYCTTCNVISSPAVYCQYCSTAVYCSNIQCNIYSGVQKSLIGTTGRPGCHLYQES